MTHVSRREMLRQAGLGFGSLALTGLLHETGLLAEPQAPGQPKSYDLAPRPGQLAPRAKAIIQLFQNGGPSQMDLFDPKPELTKRAGQPHPQGVETFQLGNKNVLLGTPFKFAPRGQCGTELSDAIPHISSVADDICLVRSMFTENNNHPFAINMFQTGKTFPGRPAMGSWICYALGTENRALPGYVVLRDPAGYNTSGKMVWSSGWLPAVYQGTEFSSSGSAVHHIQPPDPMPLSVRARSLQFIAEVNADHRAAYPSETELDARIQNFEMAARMQLAAGDVLDLSRETEATRNLYGLNNPATAGYGTRCLLARRLVESGVRFVQVFPPPGQPWDSHSNLEGGIREICSHVDQPTAALVKDLKQRGLLQEVIVLWTGEFGRLPITENADGRDHNKHAFSLVLAGGGFKTGYVHGKTDEFGYAAVEERVSVPDLHATILHQLGINHTQLTFRHNGRPERLTDPEVSGARVIESLMS